MLAPLGFLFDFDNFPINAELVENLQKKLPGRSPYDQENPGQYNLVDQFSNDAYGLPGWWESGGPTGGFRLVRERRYLAKANLDWQVDRYNRVRTGGEFTQYSLDRYVTELQASEFSDAYLERPIRWNLFLEDRLDLGDVVLVGGVRFDAYASRASRDLLLDTIAGSPTFGEYLATAGAAQYGADGTSADGKPLVIYAARSQPWIPEPPYSGLISGHHSHQLPFFLRPSGANPRLRPGARGRQLRRDGD